ncbi:MAG TPA: hypothetical protein VKH41_06425 [Myxococcota bacterium]|nr:hypothetical protein [Myxococcota bacterium]
MPVAMETGVAITGAACGVCGSREVHTDAVEQSGWILLAECPRCDHRWTEPLRAAPASGRAAVRVAAAMRPEVANAA